MSSIHFLHPRVVTSAGTRRTAASYRRSRTAPTSRYSGASLTLVPIRPRRRGERRSLRTFPGVSLRPALAFNPRPRRLSTPPDAFQLLPDVRSYGTTLSDALNHASIVDGCRLASRTSGAKVVTYAHCDVDDLERKMNETTRCDGGGGGHRGGGRRGGRRNVVVTDSIFRRVLYKRFSPIARFQHLIAFPFN